MGVHGLWKLLEAAGKPVPLESLENKVLAVDVSIWLHQMMKGYQDSRGAPVANAHLLGLFHRVCKLMFYKIKPVFVFDGGVPLLKKQTIAARRKQKAQASQNASEAKERLLKNLVKRKAVRQLLNGAQVPIEEQANSIPPEDMFELPPLPQNALNSESEDETGERLQAFMESGESANESESEPDVKPSYQLLHGFKMDLHTLDVNSEEFLSLPPDVRHDILSELKETRKQNSWGRLHEMPEESGDFSNYQLGRLLKRRNVQVSLEKAEKEMGGKVMRINELQELMEAQGVEIIEDNTVIGSSSQRIASDSRTRFVLCKDPTAAALSTEASGSTSVEIEVKESEDDLLYNEQEDFIAQMAESMIQKIVKKKQEKNVIKEEVLEKDTAVTDSDVPTKVVVAPEKILQDSWSDDEDDVSNISLSTSKAQKRKSASASPELVSSPDTSNAGPPPKILKTNESNSVDSQISVHDPQETKSNRHSEALRKSYSARSSSQTSVSREDKDSNDSLAENKGLEIVVCPGEKPDDDIFADIFESKPLERKNTEQSRIKGKVDMHVPQHSVKHLVEEKHLNSGSKEIVNSISATNKPLEIVISSTVAPGDDDIFADIFQKNDDSDMPNSVKVEIDSNCDPSEIEKFSSSDSEQEVTKPDLQSKVDSRIEKIKEEKEDEDLEVLGPPNKSVAGSDNDIDSIASGDEFDSAGQSSIVPSLSSKLPELTYDLNTMEASLEAENIDLLRERGRQERLAASITDQMCMEAQELLQLFGLPYLVAPMEAEAQCAFLDAISLTEGSITDDSDIWLFGGKKVYKNFFNQKKHVLQFTSSNISHYFKLTREQLIQLALLVGSDYTTGIQGVGPVTAMEIVAAFQCKMESDPIQSALKGLSQFKEWWNSGRPHKSNSMRLLDKKLKNVKFSEGFPSQAVVEAYLRPSVENSDETFSWGALDLPALRMYAKSKFGWTVEKTDEILLPVSKRWSSRTSQRSIDSYFNYQPHLVEGLSKMSKRVQKAVDLMGNDEDSEGVDDPDPKPTTSVKRKTSKQPSGSNKGNSKKPKRKPTTKISNTVSDEDFTVNHNHADKGSKRVKSKQAPEIFNQEEDLDGEVAENSDHGDKSSESDTLSELPVRAPTVPRERTATGVKRVGVKSSNAGKKLAFGGDSKTAVEYGTSTRKRNTSTSKGPKHSAANSSSDSESDSLQAESNATTRAKRIVKSTQSRKTQESELKTVEMKSKDLQKEKEARSLPKNFIRVSTVKRISQMESNLPGGCESGSFTDLSDKPSTSTAGASVSSELAALSEMNWEDDPWDAEDFSVEQRPKVYFGGVRPNKPRRPARPVRPRPQNPVESTDARGVQPGWVTRERLESRTAWVDDLARRKVEETIPQRERDHKAMEDAKMKAISVVKAAEARNASRLLGRQPAKRGRGKVRKNIRKILPEHNLSESSSDD